MAESHSPPPTTTPQVPQRDATRREMANARENAWRASVPERMPDIMRSAWTVNELISLIRDEKCARVSAASHLGPTLPEMQRVAEAIAESVHLRVLFMHHLSDECATALASGVARSRSLRNLHATNGSMTAVGATALLRAVAEGGTIVNISLSSCRIGSGTSGMTDFAAALLRATSLERLVLTDNSITDADATVLAEVLPNCHSLELVGLVRNRIGYPGAVAIARATVRSRRLTDMWFPYAAARTIEVMRRANALLPAVRATVVLLGQPSNTRGEATRRFFKADGDHAAWSRVVGFLSGI